MARKPSIGPAEYSTMPISWSPQGRYKSSLIDRNRRVLACYR